MFIYETHAHTKETSPCGKVPARELVRAYAHEGYNGIVITDHYYDAFFLNPFSGLTWNKKIDSYLAGYHAACDEGAQAGMDIILGLELRFTDDPNDYLVYGVTEPYLRENPRLYELSLKEFRERTKGVLLIYQAHPFRPGMNRASPTLIDGIEVHNGNARHYSHNKEASRFAHEYGLRRISGSDFHQPEDIARGGVKLTSRCTDARSFIEALADPSLTLIIPPENAPA